jgi:hypothetical protein
MTPELLTCPYCNAQVPTPALDPARSRITCPRCGETFPYRPPDTGAVTAGPPPSTPVPPPAVNGTPATPRLLQAAPTHLAVQLGIFSMLMVLTSLLLRVALSDSPATQKAFPFMFLLGAVGTVASVWLWYFRRPRTNAATALFIVGNMLLVALLVLPFALLTTDFRRSHDRPRKSDLNLGGPGKDGKSGAGRAPAELAALGYLPADSNLIVGVHVAELLREKAGKEFLENPSWKPLELALRQVERWTGLHKDIIDHVALGARTDGFPRLTVVVQTLVPYDPASFRVLLDESKPMEHHGRLLYPLLLRPIGQGALWCVGEHTLLLTLWWDPTGFPEMKELLPLKPRRGDDGLTPALRACLEKRLSRGALVWIAGTSPPAPLVAAVLPFARGSKSAPAPLKKVRVFDATLRFSAGADEVALVGDLECADVPAAEALQRFLQGQKVPGPGALKVAGPANRVGEQALLGVSVVALGGSPRGAETAAGLAALAVSPPRAQGPDAERWVSFQMRARPSVLNEALRGQGQLLPWLDHP